MEQKIKEIDRRLEDVDEEIAKLQQVRRKLKLQRDKLIDKSDFEKSEADAKKTIWNDESFPWSTMVRDKLRNVFGMDDFRSQQLETINVTMSKKDCILVSPTGGGKSLTYQLPSLCESGITLVVSPLISLIEDQIYSLEKKMVPAEMLSSHSPKEQVKHVHSVLEDPSHSTGKQMKILFVTPERLSKSKTLMKSLQKCYVNKKLERIAIDEVHCCSLLGHDYRPDYKYLGTMKTLFPDVPILGVTATCSKKILMDVQKLLNIRRCIVFQSPFNRPNLYYHVMEKPSENEEVYNLLANLLLKRYAGQNGIIYTFTIKDTETLTSELLQRDCKVRPYHAQLEQAQRTKIYKQWIKGEIQAVCATIAFGLGIDNQKTRFVIHHTMSKSMENFYQESGRCGRDGEYAECVLLYRLADMQKISTLTFTEVNGLANAYSVINYAISSKICRRDLFSKYFTEVWNEESCGKMCDCCFYKESNRLAAPANVNIISHYQTILKILQNASASETKMTALKIMDAWFLKGPKNLRMESAPVIDRSYAEQILAFLVINDYLKEDFHYTAYSTLSYIIKGPRVPEDNEIDFQPARACDLPNVEELKRFYEVTSKKSKQNDDHNRTLPISLSPCNKKRKISEKIVVSSSSLERIINSKIKEALSQSIVKTSSQSDSDDDDDDDVFIVEPKKEKEVIELDD